MTQQHFHGPVDQVAAGNIYNQLPYALCPQCAIGLMTSEQNLCSPCTRKQDRVERARHADGLVRELALFFVMWGFCFCNLLGFGVEGNLLHALSFIAAGLLTKIVVWTGELLDTWVTGGKI